MTSPTRYRSNLAPRYRAPDDARRWDYAADAALTGAAFDNGTGILTLERRYLDDLTVNIGPVLPGDAELGDLSDVDTSGVTNGDFLQYDGPSSTWEVISQIPADKLSGTIAYGNLPFSGSDVSNWDEAYSWGDHALEGYVPTVADYAALKALTGLSAGDTRYVRSRASDGDGGHGVFVWRSGDQSANVTADSMEGIWVPPLSDTSGSSGAWERLAGAEMNLLWFGGVSGAGNDNTAALQGCHDMLPDGGGTIYVESAEGVSDGFYCDGEVSFTKPLVLRGDGARASVLIYTGDSTAGAFLQSGTQQLQIDNLSITGQAGGSGEYFVSGSAGIDMQGNLVVNKARIARFDTAVKRSGGFYHSFYGVEFDRCSVFCADFNANNVAFVGCKFSFCDTVLEYQGGVGPISFTGCAIEAFTSAILDTDAGALAAFSLYGCYVENLPGTTGQLALGLASDAFDNGNIHRGAFRSATLVGNYLNLSGISRGFNATGATVGSVYSVGNTVALSAETDNYVRVGTIDRMVINDHYYTGSPSGTFNYVSAVTVNMPDACWVTDLQTGTDITPQPGWTTLTLTDGWTDAATGYDLAYRKTKGYVELRGKVVGSSATGDFIATLPADVRPAENLGFALVDDSDSVIRLRIRSTGEIENQTGGTPSGVHLDTVRFEQNG